MKNLHPAAKMKRILSACDFWFSPGNLGDDYFMQSELQDYQGYARISTLASFPKLEGWADDVSLVCEALETEAAAGRYKVVFNRALVETVARNRKRRKMRLAQQEQEQEKQRKEDKAKHKQWREKRIIELEAYLDEARKEFWIPQFKLLLKEGAEQVAVDENAEEEERDWLEKLAEFEAEMEREAEEKAEKKRLFQMTTTTDRLAEDTPEGASTTTIELKKKDGKSEDGTKEEVNDYDYSLFWETYGGEYDYQLQEENPEFAEALDELEVLENEGVDYDLGDYHDYYMENHFGSYVDGRESNLEKFLLNERIDDHVDANDFENDEELPSPIVDDGSTDYAFALVRHKRVKPEHYSYLTSMEDESLDYDDCENESVMDFYPGEDPLDRLLAEPDGWESEPEEVAKANPKPKRKTLKNYSSQRRIQVIKNAKQLASFCNNLKNSLNKDGTEAAIGFDVEYCSLEMDIRMTLPAMLQLASPAPQGPVGLIWLDKFPNHGKDMIGNDEYADLLSLLSDPNISKVGVGASSDAKHLAAWWGITDKEYVSFFFSGLVDMDELDDGNSLQEMCAAVLERNLPKLKEKGARKKKEMRKKGRRVKTAHWRRDDLTQEMKQYAADDVSCAIDIWLKLQEPPTANDTTNDVAGNNHDPVVDHR